MYTYQVRVENGFDEQAFNATSPLQTRSVRPEPASTLLLFHTDQSGLIGILRHLHQQGYVLLTLSRESDTSSLGFDPQPVKEDTNVK